MITNPNPTSMFTPLILRRVFCLSFVVAAIATDIGAISSSRAVTRGGVPASATTASKIAPWVIEHTSNGQQAEFFVVLADQADLSGAVSLPTKAEKGRYVYQTLLDKA